MRRMMIAACLMQSMSMAIPATADCNLHQIARHADPARTRIYASEAGTASIYFKADLDVNTDGTGRSYHPDDPRGRRIAFNNMGNAITRIFDARGRDITCTPRSGACFSRFMQTFEAARDAGYDPVGHARIETTGIIPWKRDAALGREVPCTIKGGAFDGYFVSQTSVAVDPEKEACDQSRYLDSFLFNATVLPRGVAWASQGTRTDDGDLVVVRDSRSGRVAFAINGDRGPARSIGEGSIALAAALNGVVLEGDETYEDVRRLARPSIQYVLFPKDDIRRRVGRVFTQADIDRVGAALFAAWGGPARLDDCSTLD